MIEKVFMVQPGLKRRFTWNFNIPKYTSDQIFEIFKVQLAKHGWTVEERARELFKHKELKFAGGDTLNIALKSKIQYSVENWMTGGDKHLTYDHVQRALRIHFSQSSNRTTGLMYI